jgi:hypothetical protein
VSKCNNNTDSLLHINPRDVIEEECYQKLLASIPNFATRLAEADEEELMEIGELVHLLINLRLRFLSDLSS